MNYELMAVEILAAVGGSKNISNVTHCATRLRLNLIDQKLIDRKRPWISMELWEFLIKVDNIS